MALEYWKLNFIIAILPMLIWALSAVIITHLVGYFVNQFKERR